VYTFIEITAKTAAAAAVYVVIRDDDDDNEGGRIQILRVHI